MTYTRITRTFGRDSANRLDDTQQPGLPGALAALESFYFAFNNGNIDVLTRVWIHDPLIRLKNPLGGVLEGIEPVSALYEGIFNGPADVWVEFSEIVAYELADSATVFSGRERGEFARNGVTVDLDIRTTRVFHRVDGMWGQAHHHGSIAEPDLLTTYRNAVNG